MPSQPLSNIKKVQGYNKDIKSLKILIHCNPSLVSDVMEGEINVILSCTDEAMGAIQLLLLQTQNWKHTYWSFIFGESS